MNGLGGWFRQFTAKLSASLRRFMQGRYGTDKLNTAILGLGLVVCIVSLFITAPLARLIATLISYALMFYAIFRSFSRNTYRRYQENRRFLLFFDRIRDRDHRYFECPKCRQTVRVPRGKGKIAIICPKCREKFVRKT